MGKIANEINAKSAAPFAYPLARLLPLPLKAHGREIHVYVMNASISYSANPLRSVHIQANERIDCVNGNMIDLFLSTSIPKTSGPE